MELAGGTGLTLDIRSSHACISARYWNTLNLMEVIEERHGRRATINASQMPVTDWYVCLETNTTAADAILDQLMHSATRFETKCSSLRKKR